MRTVINQYGATIVSATTTYTPVTTGSRSPQLPSASRPYGSETQPPPQARYLSVTIVSPG